jgi:succinate dehydrogenase / fumarate reductase, membrane anchor subunit
MTKATSRSDQTVLRDEVVSRRVRHSAARDGLREWRWQRLTAIAVIPLSLYFAASVLSLATSDRKTAADWLSLSVPVLVAVLVVLAGITHALIGVRSIVLDYVHTRTRSWYTSKLAIVTTTLLAISPDRLDRRWRSENLAPEARDR